MYPQNLKISFTPDGQGFVTWDTVPGMKPSDFYGFIIYGKYGDKYSYPVSPPNGFTQANVIPFTPKPEVQYFATVYATVNGLSTGYCPVVSNVYSPITPGM